MTIETVSQIASNPHHKLHFVFGTSMTPNHHNSKEGLISTTRLFRAMGTETYLEIVHSKGEIRKAKHTLSQAVECCFEKIKIFNRFDIESELSQFNRHLGNFRNASPDMLALALHALSFHKESDGLFDPRVLSILEHIGYHSDFSSMLPNQPILEKLFSPRNAPLKRDLKVWGEMVRFDTPMDFSGIAKGYILDKMAERIRMDGWENFLVDSGGDMVTRGTNKDKKKWTINVENIPETSLLLEITNRAIATSGITRKQWISSQGKHYHHLIHPKHPNTFSFDLLSVTALSTSAERADFLAKTLFLMGIKEGFACAKKHAIPAVFVTANTTSTSGSSWIITPEIKRSLAKQ